MLRQSLFLALALAAGFTVGHYTIADAGTKFCRCPSSPTPTPAPSPTPTPTPGPTPTPTPSPTPTPTPPPGGGYSYLGCPIYPANDAVIGYDAGAQPADVNSATIIANLTGKMDFNGGDAEGLERVNTATSATGTFTVQTNGGHNPPITSGLAGGGAGAVFHWIPGTFVMEGTTTANCSGDCHVQTILTDTCLFEQGGSFNWNGTQLKAYNGFIDDSVHSYYAQHGNKGDNWSVAGIGCLGFCDWGEEASAVTIAHPESMTIPVAASLPTATTNYAGSGGNDAGTCSGASTCTEMGDIWVLNASVTCPSTPASVVVFCQQLKFSGTVVKDTTGSGSGIHASQFTGLSANGTGGHWSAAASWMGGLPLTDFHIAKRQALSFFCC